MYTANGCGYCARAKALFNKENVDFDEREISNPKYRQELLALVGQAVTPITQIAGQTFRFCRRN